MRMIGITGGVGSGKSEVLSYLQEHYGGRAIEADRAGHLLMKKGGRCYRPIVELFGREVLDGEGELTEKSWEPSSSGTRIIDIRIAHCTPCSKKLYSGGDGEGPGSGRKIRVSGSSAAD